MTPFELEADRARDQLKRRLSAVESADARDLADRLSACAMKSPCRSAACPVCGLAFQQVAVSAFGRFIAKPAEAVRNRMTSLTIAPGDGWVTPADLTVAAIEAVGQQITAALASLDLPPALGSLEVSFNEDATGRVADHWGPHGHVLVHDWLSDAQKKVLRQRFSRSEVVRRPVKIEELDDDPRGHRYPFKPQRIRRVTFLNTDDPRREPYLDTKRRDVRAWQSIALALVAHELGFSRRLLTHGIDREAMHRHLEGLGWARDGP